MKVCGLKDRKKQLTAVIFSDGSELLLDREFVLGNITVGQEIEDIDELVYQSDFKRAKARSLWYLTRSDHSQKLLYDKLIRGGFSKKACQDAVARMIELGLIDDEAYAKRLASSLKGGGASNREIEYKLILKGIPANLAKELTFENEDECQRIKYLLEHKFESKLSTEEGVKKVFAALMRKGFSPSDIRSALKEYCEEE